MRNASKFFVVGEPELDYAMKEYLEFIDIEDSEKYSVDIAVKKMAEIYGECVEK